MICFLIICTLPANRLLGIVAGPWPGALSMLTDQGQWSVYIHRNAIVVKVFFT